MSLIRWKTAAIFLTALGLAQGCSSQDSSSSASDDEYPPPSGPPIKIGVLLPLTGPNALDFNVTLDWAAEEINKLGVRGHPIQFDYEDIGKFPDDDKVNDKIAEAAKRFLDDPEILAVIGTDYDDSTFKIAPKFIKAKKLLVSPSATTAEITRAFGGKKFIWRTLESDVSQAETMMVYAKNTGAKKVAVLSTFDLYGATFFDWIPFHAEQLGVEITGALRMKADDASCEDEMTKLAKGDGEGEAPAKPDVLFLIPGTKEQAFCMVDKARTLFPDTRLMFSDGGQYDGLFEQLGAKAEGVEGISIEAARPSGGDGESPFDLAFKEKFKKDPPPYAANVWDSVALIAYAMQRSDLEGGDALADSFREVVDSEGESANGEHTSWDGKGIRRALDLIRRDHIPYVSGATGELYFDEKLGTDTVATTYAVWQVKNGKQQWDAVTAGGKTLTFPANYFTKEGRKNAFDTAANEALLSGSAEESTGYTPAEPRNGLWAFIGAVSGTWANYRHQADALNMYQLVKAKGIPDDHIIFMIADDIATNPLNKEQGVVRNVAKGENLYHDLEIDYKVDNTMNAERILAILKGDKQDGKNEKVIESTANDDVFVFWVGHGGDDGVLVGGDTPEAAESGEGSFIEPQPFADAVQYMFDNKRYRRLLLTIEACHGGVMGTKLKTPGAVYLTGASPHENSFGANFDPALETWVADAFAYSLSSRMKAAGPVIPELYKQIFLEVRGSHAKMYNGAKFGKVAETKVEDIVK